MDLFVVPSNIAIFHHELILILQTQIIVEQLFDIDVWVSLLIVLEDRL